MHMAGGLELIVIMFAGLFVYALPLAFAVFVVVFLVKINNAVSDIRKRLDQLEQKHQ